MPYITRTCAENLTFAEDAAGVMKHVNEVPRGSACGCKCPGCVAPLIARQGDVNTHTFAHVPGTECRGGGVESALHRAGKQLLMTSRQMVVPSFSVVARAADGRRNFHEAARTLEARHVTFDSVEEELRMDAIRPDIVAQVNGCPLAIEIAVFHPCEQEKIAYYRSRQIACVEVDLSPLIGSTLDWASLTEAVVDGISVKKWLYCDAEDSLSIAAQDAAQALADESDRQFQEGAEFSSLSLGRLREMLEADNARSRGDIQVAAHHQALYEQYEGRLAELEAARLGIGRETALAMRAERLAQAMKAQERRPMAPLAPTQGSELQTLRFRVLRIKIELSDAERNGDLKRAEEQRSLLAQCEEQICQLRGVNP